MSLFKPTSDERVTLKKAVTKYAHDPIKSKLLASLDSDTAQFEPGNEEWEKLKFCTEQHHMHMQTELRRDPTKKAVKVQVTQADMLARRFHPNFS